ncbi:unnamed protein product [Mytilus coruscus]|uniref:Uncharacterized protein n=1 Tax=Mytilus coruscus TaxID=42192 RepID=A0A6J8E197_MYTCO|nr:unnamed protein product [Mytilus coruscus]
MCQNIVGTEKHVKTIRAMNNVRDHLQTNKSFITITSGSYGEGLQMQGSDLDIMVVRKFTEVCKDINFHLNPRRTYFTMDTEDTQLGFTKLRLIHSHDQRILEDCEKIGNGSYFSNSLVKQRLSTEYYRTVHGPCLSDKHGMLDVAFCVRSKSWITTAKQWVVSCNTSTYKQYYTYISILLLAIRHDAVSGWLLLASYFYGTKQYNTALEILQYSLSKCTPEKMYRKKKLSRVHHELLNLEIVRKMSIIHMLKLMVIDIVSFTEISKLIPHELQMELEIVAPFGEPYNVPPVVCAHFLFFLCHYHLNNVEQYRNSLQDLQLTIQENYFIDDVILESVSYNILGISFQLVGDLELARQAYIKSTYFDPNDKYNSAFMRLTRIG